MKDWAESTQTKQFTFVLPDRQIISRDLLWDCIAQPEEWWFPPNPVTIIFRCCARGLEMARKLDLDYLKVALIVTYGLNPFSKIVFEERI